MSSTDDGDYYMLCMPDLVCYAYLFGYYSGYVAYATQPTGAFSASNPTVSATLVSTTITDEDKILGFGYPAWIAKDDPSGAWPWEMFWLPADDTTWTVGSELTFWTGIHYDGDTDQHDNKSVTITFGGASALALASSAALAAAAVMF